MVLWKSFTPRNEQSAKEEKIFLTLKFNFTASSLHLFPSNRRASNSSVIATNKLLFLWSRVYLWTNWHRLKDQRCQRFRWAVTNFDSERDTKSCTNRLRFRGLQKDRSLLNKLETVRETDASASKWLPALGTSVRGSVKYRFHVGVMEFRRQIYEQPAKRTGMDSGLQGEAFSEGDDTNTQ